MFFLQKKLWIAWSKLRFLRLPVERRVRLEMTTDGRHITFLLVSLYEAGYGVQVVGSPSVFRELICLRKSAPIPFVIGGGERKCGISITDKSGYNHGGHGEHGGGKRVLLDYDFFSGLTTKSAQEHETGKIIDSKIIETTEDMEVAAGLRLAGQAGAHIAPGDRISQIGDRVTGSDGGNQSADSMEFLEGQSQAGLQTDNQKGATIRTANDHTAPGEYSSSVKFDSLDPSRLALRADLRSLHLTPAPALDCGKNSSSPATSYPPLVTAPEVPLLDAGPSTLDSSAPVTSHSPLATALRAPYFMHPSVYHRGLHKRRSPSTALDSAAKQRRRFRIGFFGTHDREFYTKHYHFPGMNRFEILEVFLQKFGNRMRRLRGFPRDWDPCEIAVSIDSRGGDRRGKFFLSQDNYFEALKECDFVLSPPGWCMPISHNLIEAVFCGAIPITNGGEYMAEPLKDGETCLEFQDADGLLPVIDRALAMDAGDVELMRRAVLEHYDRFLEPKAFAEEFAGCESERVFVNVEEKSVPFIYENLKFN